MLTSSQINEYHENGYTTLPNLLNLEQIKSFISQIEQITKGNSLEKHDASKMEMEQDQEPEGKLVRRLYEPCTYYCLLYTSPSPRDGLLSRMPSSA